MARLSVVRRVLCQPPAGRFLDELLVVGLCFDEQQTSLSINRACTRDVEVGCLRLRVVCRKPPDAKLFADPDIEESWRLVQLSLFKVVEPLWHPVVRR